MKRQKLKFEIWRPLGVRVVIWRSVFGSGTVLSSLEQDVIEGENPVPGRLTVSMRSASDESSCLGMQLKMGGKFHLKLNIGERPIAHK